MSELEQLSQKKKADGSDAMAELKRVSPEKSVDIRDELRQTVIAEIQEVARETPTQGKRSLEQNDAIQNFKDSVEEELRTFGTQEGDIFSILPEYHDEVADMVKKSLHSHIIGFIRAQGLHKDGNVFDPRHDRDLAPAEKRNRRAYVQEFTSMLLENYYVTDMDKKAAINLSKYNQPEYVKSLFDGSLIKETLKDKNVWNDEKISNVFTPYTRVRIATQNFKRIRDAITDIAENYDSLTDNAILEYINKHREVGTQEWTEPDVQEFLTSPTRARIAANFPGSVFDAVSRMANNYRALTDVEVSKIAQEINVQLTPSQAKQSVPQFARRYFCIESANPRRRIQQWMTDEIRPGGANTNYGYFRIREES